MCLALLSAFQNETITRNLSERQGEYADSFQFHRAKRSEEKWE